MSNKRTTMRKLREILRLRLQAGLSIRAISRSTKLSVGGVQKLLSRAEALSLTWPLPAELDDARLAELFYPGADTHASPRREAPDWAAIHEELKRPHMTRQLVWEEYTQRYPNRCYGYSQFCDRYRDWLARQQRTMRQTHTAGEKCFVDYGGDTVPVIDAGTGETQPAQLFIAVLGASDYTFAEATWTQTLPDWLASHTRGMTYFGGVPAAIVPDNLRSGVSRACRYDPDINPSYQQWAEHYQTAILPARPHKPRDKAKAEQGVLLAQRWILARLRHHQFFALDELNRHIATLLDELNHRPFKRRPGSRHAAFETLDKPALKPLPPQPYEYVHIKPVTVHIDYHVLYQQHYYSVPHQYVGERVELQASDSLIELYFHQRPIATHARRDGYGFTTDPAHMPERHRAQQQWSPERLKRWAAQLGPDVHTWVRHQLERRAHPEQAYRTCLGLLQLSKRYPASRLNAACQRANQAGLVRLKQVTHLLESNQDRLPDTPDADTLTTPTLPQDHENVRGPHHFN